jgi:putative ABC transport system ATP-binding protein
MFNIENLKKTYLNPYGQSETIYQADLHIDTGELVAFMGMWGSGRTALLKTLSFSERPDEGKIYLNHLNVTDYTLLQLSTFRRHFVGILSLETYLINNLTVAENMALMLKGHQKTVEEEREAIIQIAELLKVEKLLHKYPSQLSTIQNRIIQLVCVLINEPKLLIINDIESLFGNQNVQIMNLLNQLNYEGMTIIIGTNSETYAHSTQRIVRLHEGHVVEDEVIIEVSVV